MLDKAVVDLSHWDEVDSFKDAKVDGVVGIIHKATESNNYFDPTYNQRKKDALAAGLLWGAYHFLRPGNMKDQAQYFVSKAGKNLDLYAADHRVIAEIGPYNSPCAKVQLPIAAKAPGGPLPVVSPTNTDRKSVV